MDREFVARELGFVDAHEEPMVTQNSMDAVADRDFVVEFCSLAALIAMHQSRLCEDLVLWSSAEFGFVTIGDAYTTGSSLMPQKKNPDICELTRGKTGRVVGNLVSLLTTLKGLPLIRRRRGLRPGSRSARSVAAGSGPRARGPPRGWGRCRGPGRPGRV